MDDAVSCHDIAAIWVAFFPQDASDIVVNRTKEEISLPGSRGKGGRKSAGDPADVVLMKGDAPMVICVPYGRKGGAGGSDASSEAWSSYSRIDAPNDGSADSPLVELAEAVRERFWMATCLTPYVVMCCLDRSKLDVGIPLDDNIPSTARDTACGRRAAAAWRNYHVCIEIAKQEVAAMNGKTHDHCWHLGCILPRVPAMIVRTGGDVLVAEILVEGNYETPYAQVGYGLREFEIDVVSRKPGEGAKRAFDKNVLAQTFRTFDADGSGEVDADELKAAANKFGIPITDEEVDATMAELGKTRDDEINKTEFIAWFQSLAEDVSTNHRPAVPFSVNTIRRLF